MNIQEHILISALEFVTQREIPGNQGWEDQRFETLMKQTGWKVGEAWCAYFVELVLMTAGFTEHAGVMSPSAVQSWRNCKQSELFKTSDTPKTGSLVIWQMQRNGKPLWMGHAGIVVAVERNIIVTVEGNTTSQGIREGEVVALKIRDINMKPMNGLNLLGFAQVIAE